jgi:phosphatidylglycerol:prolipoprotein diacylglycerol transferase
LIEWNVNPEIFGLGPLSIRWYGLLFASSFILGYAIIGNMFEKEGRSEKDLNDLLWYMILGTVIGARLGHCLFYNPEYYLTNPLEILKVYKGGLASHGAAIGILLSLSLFVKRKKGYSYLWLLDRIVIITALAATFIRIGNLFNSEIIGVETTLPWSFIFLRIDEAARHPAQLYEAIVYLITFLVLYSIYRKMWKELENGFLFGLFMIMVFGARFLIEFVKENQTHFEATMPINMGQILSIPLVIAGVYLVVTRRKKENKSPA